MAAGVTSRAGRLLLVNYHYIRDPAQYRHPGVHPLAPAEFRRQVTELGERLLALAPSDVEALVLDGAAPVRDGFFLTFDDGLTDHYQVATEFLEPNGLRGAFFVTSRPLLERRALSVHKIHWLRSELGPTFQPRFREYVSPAEWDRLRPADLTERSGTVYIYDTAADAETKFMLNFILPPDLVDTAASDLLRGLGVNEAEFCARTYMGEDEIRRLADAGHVIGLHTHTHQPLSRLSQNEVRRELEANTQCLARIIGEEPSWLSYPYGREWALPADDRPIAESGVRIGITLIPGWSDRTHPPLRTRRVNTNEVGSVLGDAS